MNDVNIVLLAFCRRALSALVGLPHGARAIEELDQSPTIYNKSTLEACYICERFIINDISARGITRPKRCARMIVW